MYKPLPDSLTIKTSKVNGLGLFAKEFISTGTNFGVSHYEMKDQIIRTPLGGFVNHSNNPNCVKIELHNTNGHSYYSNITTVHNTFNYKKWNLVAIKDIKKEEELTLIYTFYNI